MDKDVVCEIHGYGLANMYLSWPICNRKLPVFISMTVEDRTSGMSVAYILHLGVAQFLPVSPWCIFVIDFCQSLHTFFVHGVQKVLLILWG